MQNTQETVKRKIYVGRLSGWNISDLLNLPFIFFFNTAKLNPSCKTQDPMPKMWPRTRPLEVSIQEFRAEVATRNDQVIRKAWTGKATDLELAAWATDRHRSATTACRLAACQPRVA